MGYKVAVVGATGNVGREMLNILAEREFPIDEVHAVASRRSLGTEVSFGDRTLKCRDLEQVDFRGMDFCLMSAGSAVSKEWSPKIGAMGCLVIDNSSCWRYEPDIPLVVPEVNAHVLQEFMARERPAQHHRQSQLLHRPARRGAEAAARRGAHTPRGRGDLPVGVRRRQGCHG